MKSTIKKVLKLTEQKLWWCIRNYGIYVIVGTVLGSVWWYNTADYRIKNFENTFMEMLMGKKTAEDSNRAVTKMISGAKNTQECLTTVKAMTEILQTDKYNPADVIVVLDEQLYKDCI